MAWTGIGVPAAFPFEALFEDYNEAIHTPGDFLERLDTSGGKQAKFAKLGVEFMIEVAKSAGAAPSASACGDPGLRLGRRRRVLRWRAGRQLGIRHRSLASGTGSVRTR